MHFDYMLICLTLKTMKKSFTLIELLVVIAIIGVLAALVIPNLTQTRAKARDVRRIEDLRTLQNALELYYLDHNVYPSGPIGSNSLDGFCLERSLNEDGSCPSEKPDQFCNLIKPYLARLPKDPQFRWSDPSSPCYYYITDDTGQAYKAAAKMEKDSQRAENDGGTNSQWFEISDTGFKGLTTLSFNPPGGLPGNWWDANWTYRKKITINHTKIDSDLTDFPVLVKLTSANFDFSKANANGNDLRFTSDDGTTLLKFERERHDQANSLAEYWVKIPAVSASADTIFYIYYRTESTADGADPTNVWDTNHKIVQHLKEASGTLYDSTNNGKNGTPSGLTDIEAKIARGKETAGNSGSKISFSSWSFNTFNNGFFGSFWLKTTSNGRLFTIEGAYVVQMESDGRLYFIMGGGDSGGGYSTEHTYSNTGVDLRDGVWHYISFTYSGDVNEYGGGTQKLYVDGVLQDDVDTNCFRYNINSLSRPFEIGWDTANGMGSAASFDEVSVSDIARTAAWIKASYNSGNDSLLIYGSEEQN